MRNRRSVGRGVDECGDVQFLAELREFLNLDLSLIVREIN
jgi:hypothetical protein